jgi:hypothetical protein
MVFECPPKFREMMASFDSAGAPMYERLLKELIELELKFFALLLQNERCNERCKSAARFSVEIRFVTSFVKFRLISRVP